jgi:predicted ATPase
LEELRLVATEERIEADLRLGRHAELIPELERLSAAHPLRERLWGQLMLALYRSGRQGDALSGYRHLRRTLVEQLGIDPSVELQNLEIAILRQNPAIAGPVAPRGRAAFLLPLAPTELIGRDRDARAVEELLAEHRLVTLLGPGGVGKTRLAIEVAHRLVPQFPDGVLFVDLSGLRDPSVVLSVIGLETGGGERPWDVLLDQRVLLVLDNFEQVIEAAGKVAELISRCPELRILVTSRAPMRLRGEQQYEVATLGQEDASVLFEARAREALVHWEPDRDLVHGIVDRLDGLPLAIELTAARVRVVQPQLLPEQLIHPLSAMARGARDAPARHRTLRDTIAWSYDLLSEPAKTCFRALSTFAGGFDLAAAGAVAGGDVDTLADLQDQSLVQRSSDRYRMLETIRQFAGEAASTPGEEATARDRHLTHYLAVVQAASHAADRAGDRDGWMAICDLERDNLRVAFDHALSRDDLGSASALCNAIGVYWLIVGATEEGERWTQALLGMIGPDEPLHRAQIIALAGEYPRWAGEHERAIALRREGVELARMTDDRNLLATLLDDMAWSLAASRQHAKARLALDEALSLRRGAPDDRSGLWHTLAAIADLQVREGDTDAALRTVQECREIEVHLDLEVGDALQTDDLEALVLLRAGLFDRAEERYRRVLADASQLDFRIVMLNALIGLAEITARREPDRAALLLGMADRIHAEARIGFWDVDRHAEVVAAVESALGADLLAEVRANGRATPIPTMAATALDR